MGIDLTAADVAGENLADLPNVTIQEGNLLEDLSRLGSFDFIYCQEVLHHTGDPEGGLRNLAKLLAPGGEIAIYVYKRKAPVREFTDDYLRERISALDYDQAMEVSAAIASWAAPSPSSTRRWRCRRSSSSASSQAPVTCSASSTTSS